MFLLLINFIWCKSLYYLERIRELEVRKFFKDEAFNVFKLELLNSKGLTEIHAGLVAKVCHVINARFLLP